MLLLEAGGPDNDDPAITTPGRWVSLIGSQFDWGYATEPEAGLQNRRITFPRGKVHGGSSAINAMTFIRGHRFCFDSGNATATRAGDTTRCCRCSRSRNATRCGETPYRGGDGALAVSLCTDPHAGHKAFLAAVAQQGFKSDARFDFNLPAPVNTARLLPEEHSRRPAAQRRGCVPDAGADARRTSTCDRRHRPPS